MKVLTFACLLLLAPCSFAASVNGVMMQYFHWYTPSYQSGEGLWTHLASDASMLASRGFTALWLPPAYKGLSGAQDAGYGTYDRYDFGEFNQRGSVWTKYGTRQQYQSAIAAAHRAGLQVYADMVMNHMMGADKTESAPVVEVDPKNRNHEISGTAKTLSVPTVFEFPGRRGQYSKFIWNWRHFTGIDEHELTRFGSGPSIYKFRGQYPGFQEEVDHENGNYDYLMGVDLDLRNPEVDQELKTWGGWYVRNLKVDGFRLDAVKHIPFAFAGSWVNSVRTQLQDPHSLFVVGEYWSQDVSKLNHYLQVNAGKLSLFDVPLHYHFWQAGQQRGNYDMRLLLRDTLAITDPDHAVTFVDNHDTQPLQSLESPVADWFKPIAYATVLLRAGGYPSVFYADYYGAVYHDKGKTVRMTSFQKILDLLLNVRREYAYGLERDYFDHPDVVGWTRSGDTRHPHAMAVVLNDGAVAGSKQMCFESSKRSFKDVTQSVGGVVTLDAQGCGSFGVSAASMSIWVSSP